MTKGVTVALDSSRLADYTAPVPCYVCGTDNTCNTEYCHNCMAPMALAHQARSQKVRPQMVAAIGASAAGKTVYLGMLMDMLSRQQSGLQLLARGAFSITLQQTTMAALGRCEFPKKTPSEPDHWNWVHCQIRRPGRRRPMELIMPDMAGDAVLEEVDHPNSFQVIRAFLQHAGGTIILIDTIKLKEGTLDQDFFTMKLISYLSEMGTGRKRGRYTQPVALVFSKADQCPECTHDPNNFAKTRSPALWQQCNERFSNYRFFAVSVAGAIAYLECPGDPRVRVPLRIEPRGIVEPFEWLLDEIEKHPRRNGRG